jgi:hypothetical protein
MVAVAGHKRDNIKASDLERFKLFKKINALLSRLHATACERDRAHNRELHMDQYMALLLLYMFNPICVSLRALQQASTLKKVQRVLHVPRASLGSLSEAARVFDADLLKGIVEELALELRPLPHDPRLDDIQRILTLVDGTVLAALPKMLWAVWQSKHNALKAHVQFELLKGVPISGPITEANADEREVLGANLQPGRAYVTDRGYAKYKLLQDIVDIGSSFVCRIRDNAVVEVVQERELSQEALDAGVVRDAVVWLGEKAKRGDLRQPVRIVQIACTPHIKTHKNGRGGPQQGDTILIATDMLDLPAEVVALVYQCRWEIEIFFRTFKHLLGCRHLLSQCENGIRLQMYAAIIACMLIAIYTGRKPNVRTYEMLTWYFMGWADEEEMESHIAGLQKQG